MKNESKHVTRTSKLSFLAHPFIAAVLCIASSEAVADQFYVTVTFECHVSKPELRISFRGYWNEAGEEAIALAGNSVIDPRALVSFTQTPEGEYTLKTKSISKKCVLGKNGYAIDIAPLMASRFHPEGFCAARIGAIANVKLRNKRIVSEGVDACTETGLVTTEILISMDQSIAYKKVPADVFYAD